MEFHDSEKGDQGGEGEPALVLGGSIASVAGSDELEITDIQTNCPFSWKNKRLFLHSSPFHFTGSLDIHP